MITTTVAGRTWHFTHALLRPSAEHNESKWGRTGGTGHPMSVALAPDEILFVVSRGSGHNTADWGRDILCRIGKMTIDEDHIGDFARGGLTWPVGLAVGGDGRVYCSDEYMHAILIFDPDAIQRFPEFDEGGEEIGRWGERGSAPGQIDGPAGIEFDADDNLLVVDSRNDRVQRFTKDGEFLSTWGSSGSGDGQFDRPWGITIDSKGDVYVADWGNSRVQKFAPDGAYLMSFGTPPELGGDLNHPADVAVDSDGDVYITDWGNHRVQIYEPDGQSITALYGDAKKPTDSKAGTYVINRNSTILPAYDRIDDFSEIGKFRRPKGIEVDDKDRVIVADGMGRLQVYAKIRDYVEPEISNEAV